MTNNYNLPPGVSWETIENAMTVDLVDYDYVTTFDELPE